MGQRQRQDKRGLACRIPPLHFVLAVNVNLSQSWNWRKSCWAFYVYEFGFELRTRLVSFQTWQNHRRTWCHSWEGQCVCNTATWVLTVDKAYQRQAPQQCMSLQLTEWLFDVCSDLSCCLSRKSACSPIRSRQLFIYCFLSPIFVNKNDCGNMFRLICN